MADFYRTQQKRSRIRSNALIAVGTIVLLGCIVGLMGGGLTSPRPNVALVDDAVATPVAWKNEAGDSLPLPAEDVPLARTFAALKSRAESGDAESTLRLFRDLQRCRFTASVNQQVASNAKSALTLHGAGLSANVLDDREKQLDALQGLLDQAKKNQALCDGTTIDQLAQLAPVTQRAAQLGDDHAAECYVSGRYLMQNDVATHADWTADYRQNAISVSDQAIARGDWRMVAAVADAYAHADSTDAFSHVTGQSAAMAYRYIKLETLGAAAADAEYFQNALDDASRNLDSEVIAVDNAWAQDTYRRYFAAHPDAHAVRQTELCGNAVTRS